MPPLSALSQTGANNGSSLTRAVLLISALLLPQAHPCQSLQRPQAQHRSTDPCNTRLLNNYAMYEAYSLSRRRYRIFTSVAVRAATDVFVWTNVVTGCSLPEFIPTLHECQSVYPCCSCSRSGTVVLVHSRVE